jgi:hypothetical protein
MFSLLVLGGCSNEGAALKNLLIDNLNANKANLLSH